MTLLFKRSVALIVQPRPEDITGPPTRGKLFRDLTISFLVEKSFESNPNKIQIRILNLNPDSRGFMEQENLFVTLTAGYIGEDFIKNPSTARIADEIVAQGDSGTKQNPIITDKQGSDFITTINISDGELNLSKAKVNKSLGPGVTFEQVIRVLTDAVNLPISTLKGLRTEKFNNGISLSGEAKQLLDKFLAKQDLEWTIHNGTIEIKPIDQSVDQSKLDAVLLTTRTGLLGSPSKRETGVEFVSLLQPKLRPGKLVKIESREVNGFFITRRVIHSGDTRIGEFQSRCEAIPLGATI